MEMPGYFVGDAEPCVTRYTGKGITAAILDLTRVASLSSTPLNIGIRAQRRACDECVILFEDCWGGTGLDHVVRQEVVAIISGAHGLKPTIQLKPYRYPCCVAFGTCRCLVLAVLKDREVNEWCARPTYDAFTYLGGLEDVGTSGVCEPGAVVSDWVLKFVLESILEAVSDSKYSVVVSLDMGEVSPVSTPSALSSCENECSPLTPSGDVATRSCHSVNELLGR